MKPNNNFSPEHYILLGSLRAGQADAELIISRAKAQAPEKFEGNVDRINFEFRYVPPFEKDFHELKRLQGIAAEAAGRRNEFKGYILIDVSEWLTHQNEDYLNKALLFLIDMSDWWKYIFFVDGKNSKAAKELVGEILSVFFHDNIPCAVKETTAERPGHTDVNILCTEHGVICSPSVKKLFQELLKQGLSESVVSALLCELSWKNLGHEISMHTLIGCLMSQDLVTRYMMTEKEYGRLVTYIKENLYEKEAV
jgi:hypothetical protein